MKKKDYVKPQLTNHGTIEALTRGGSTGGSLDADFGRGTPRGDLTFS